MNGPGANKNVRQGTPEILLDPNDPETSILQTLTVKNGNLHISSVEDLDKQRNYTCVVQNRLGTASGDVSLILVGGMGFTLSAVFFCLFLFLFFYF